MKKNLFNFAMLGAIALMGSVGFSACSDDLDEGTSAASSSEVSVVGDDIPVNLVFNVSTSASANTRMSAAAVQESGSGFRGMSEGHLYAFNLKNGTAPDDGKWVWNPGTGDSYQNLGKSFPTFATLMASGVTAAPRILELSLPSGTNSLVFYGKAPKTGTSNAEGSITATFDEDDVSKNTFAYDRRLNESLFGTYTVDPETSKVTITSPGKFIQAGNVLAGIMTGLADMGFKPNSIQKADRSLYFWYCEALGLNQNGVKQVGWDDADYIKIWASPKRSKVYNTELQNATNYPDNLFSGNELKNEGDYTILYRARDITTGELESNDANFSNTKQIAVTIDGQSTNYTFELYHADITWHRYGIWYEYKSLSTADRTAFLNAHTNLNADQMETHLSALGEKLGESYNSFMSKEAKEMRAASSEATLSVIKDLFHVINSVKNAKPTTLKEWCAVKFATNFIDRIKLYYDSDSETWSTSAVSNIKSYSQAANNSVNAPDISDTDLSDITDFPTGEKYGIPPGATTFDISYDYGSEDKKYDKDYGGLYSFIVNIANYDLGGHVDGSGNPLTYVNVLDYVYPAELWYFGNSPIRVSNVEMGKTGGPNYPASATAWLNEASWSGNEGDSGPDGTTADANAPQISGETPFETSTTVTITIPEGASVYYTTDGSTPTSSSSVYSVAFTLTNSTLVRAIAIKEGVSSTVTSKQFTLNSDISALWKVGHVESNTKSVAMKNNINYGVALLETRVKYGAATIYDNNQHFHPEETNKAINTTSNPFTLTGIIIGNQPKMVGWNYTAPVVPADTDDTNMTKSSNWSSLVYDKISTASSAGVDISPAGSSTPAVADYTLLLDNYTMGWTSGGASSTGAQIDQSNVFVALEFKNNGDNFWAQNNMVRKGGTFYIIGKLEIVSGDTPTYTGPNISPTHTSDGYPMPPYDTSNNGALKDIKRVFMQDHKTKVTFTLGEHSLKYAYVTVPNLSASQVSLGLSVDIEWEQGLDFGEVILGGNSAPTYPSPTNP